MIWPRRIDAWTAAALVVIGQVELAMADTVDGPRVLQHIAFAVIAASIAWRRSAPLAAATTAAAGLAGQTLVGDAPVVSGFLAILVVTASVGAHPRWRRAAAGLALLIASSAVYPLSRLETSFADEVGNVAIFVVLWVVGRAFRVSTDSAVSAEPSRPSTTRARWSSPSAVGSPSTCMTPSPTG